STTSSPAYPTHLASGLVWPACLDHLMHPAANEAPKRAKLRHNAFSGLRTLLRNIKTLLEATHDIAQRALTLFPFGCARVETGNLPGGGHTIVVIPNDCYVQSAAALWHRAQFSQYQSLKLRSCLRRLLHHRLFLARGVRALWIGDEFARPLRRFIRG